MKNIFRLSNGSIEKISILILLLLTSCLIVGNLFFLFGFKLNILSCLIVVALMGYFIKFFSVNVKEISLFLLIILVSCLTSIYFFDISDDGQGYHLDAIIALKEGWNPIYEKYTEPVAAEIYVNHYSKGKELISSYFYFITNKMEASKTINFLIVIACFGFCKNFLVKFFSNRKSAFLSLLITLSPTVITQIFSNYVDGFAYNSWIILLITMVAYFYDPNKKNKYLFIASVVLFSTLKFTSMPVLVFTGAGFFIYWIIKKNKFSIDILYLLGIIGLLVLLTNINPYIINVSEGKSIFYPAYGKNQNVLSYHLPVELEEKPNIYKFFISNFYETGRPKENYKDGLKIPFTFKISEFKNLAYTTTLAGFGVLFSGILILSFILYLIALLFLKSNYKIEFLFLIIGILFYAAILPASWMSRVIPYAYLLPILFLLFFELSSNRNKILKYLNKITFGLLCINILFFIVIVNVYNTYYSMENRFILNELSMSEENYCVKQNEYISNLEHLKEWGINYKFCELNSDKNELIYFKPISERFGISIKGEIKNNRKGIHRILHDLYSRFTD